MKIIEINNLTKSYGKFIAVDDISFDVEKGHLFAFLGVNGAGKSTTIHMIATRLQQSNGAIFVDGFQAGKDDAEIRKRIGLVFQDNVLDDVLTVKENLDMWGRFYGMSKTDTQKSISWITDTLLLEPILKKQFRHLSGGQKRRAEIARALLHRPAILFLDEPTTGLDPQTRVDVWKTIASLQQQLQMTVFLTTHYMEEAAEANQIVVIDKGKIKAQGTPAELKRLYASDTLRLQVNDNDFTATYLNEHRYSYSLKNDLFQVSVQNSLQAYHILRYLEDSITDFELIKGSLDDVFINLVKENTHAHNLAADKAL
ncbi:ABC transporter [Terribacillus saccharophilus]|uniref:ABC transporter ATP-binding protein n=1 Tax=Terribacillus saccharophilus TaxID=361277 RepID=UPI000BA527BA|nr:ABC transporter ATP-binding protein [Terribacillus saccharophilus]PAF34935.1 ABC transporter [Terribacillus saccharophilus]PAF35645.1 ABC transporter [Terribacillus saccharophilus]